MTPSFQTNLFGTTTPGTWLTCLAFTIPPSMTNTSSAISISLPGGVPLQSIDIPGGMNWDSNMTTLTIPSTFTAPNSTVSLTLSNGATATFSVFLAGSPQDGIMSSLEVNSSGWMMVTSTGQGVSFKGFTPLIQSIPENGYVNLQDPVFLIPNVTGADFSFMVAGDVTVSDPDAVAILIEDSVNFVTILETLGRGAIVTITSSIETIIGTFTVQRLSDTTIPSGGQSVLVLQPNGSFVVASLAADASLRGNNVQFNTIGAADFIFTIATDNLSYASPPVSFENTISPSSTTFGSNSSAPGSVEITDSGTAGAQTGFTLATDAGTWDPTIINNGDMNP
ncbi:MAG: hypothetical protein ABUT39_01305 [Acidobacteriota bacterium]